MDQRDALYQFALAIGPTDPPSIRVVLEEFLIRYPEHREALLEFAVELVLDGPCLIEGDDPR